MAEPNTIPDQAVRLAAATTFDRNVVVIAGAGTGKTTLLVNRLLYLLMRRAQPLDLAHIVALTFTNKAATEMKLRLRERLRALTADDGTSGMTGGGPSLGELRDRYGWTTDEVHGRAAAALRDVEKAQIGTLHSFAAHLLRLYPIEAGVAPTFRTDEGDSRFEAHFSEAWELWLERELGVDGPDHARWRTVLASFDLGELRAFAYCLRDELIDLPALSADLSDSAVSPALQAWLNRRRAVAAELLARYDGPRRRKTESVLEAAIILFDRLFEQGSAGLRDVPPDIVEWLNKDLGEPTKGWTEADFAEAESVQRVASRLLSVDQSLLQQVTTLVMPFVLQVRRSFLDAGWVTFDGLLAKARTLLREYPAIRARLKQDYRALLVDEFQDTDPVQYEIVLYLAEQPDRQATSWRDVEVEPGKLFIVGDPKQSIYAFRRADIEAFDQVTAKLEQGGALRCELATNFRSHGLVLDVVNGLFNRLLVPLPSVQPPNVPLIVQPNRIGSFRDPGVALQLAASEQDDEALKSSEATQLEADEIAREIAQLLTPQEAGDQEGSADRLRPGHIALLFRKFTQAEHYLDALRRYDIRYIVDGEKHFYRRQEVIDLVNLLTCVENPTDRLALVAVLRSPIGGVPDQALVELRQCDALDYRQPARLSAWASPHRDAVHRLYEILGEIRQQAPRLRLPEVLSLLFQRFPLLELAAASLHGEQAVANLFKVRQMAADLADRPTMTLTGFVELMSARLAEQPDEAESALAEDSLDAVRILTIHKAKGLEFPVVILAGMHHGGGAPRGSTKPMIRQDWSTGVQGVEFGDVYTLGAVMVAEKARIREAAERSRLLYVAVTRARERLILSGARTRRRSPGTLLDLVRQAAGSEPGLPDQPEFSIGRITIPQRLLRSQARRPARAQRPRPAPTDCDADDEAVPAIWSARDRRLEACRSTPLTVTATSLQEALTSTDALEPSAVRYPGQGKAVGTLVHRCLQQWDFRADPTQLSALVDRLAVSLVGEADDANQAAQEAVLLEARELLTTFVGTAPYERLRRAMIVGREMPFLMPWRSGTQVMEGVIDLLYRLDGELWIADYKTDMIRPDQAPRRAEIYRGQADVYRAAVEQALGQPIAAFEFIFVRLGLAIPWRP